MLQKLNCACPIHFLVNIYIRAVTLYGKIKRKFSLGAILTQNMKKLYNHALNEIIHFSMLYENRKIDYICYV